jgi:protein gp37
MGETKIEWCDFTFNPWVGCTKVSPGCDHCYAEGWAKRTGQSSLWAGTRRRTTRSNWLQPLKWNREARETGIHRKVFCASLGDVFDNQVPGEWRTDLFNLIWHTQHLEWLLLTKRPQNIRAMIETSSFLGLPANVWLGTTAENQEEADRRIPHLLAVPATVRFLSCEPLLGPVDISRTEGIGWVIAGGESGGGKRPMNLAWMRALRDQCVAGDVPFFGKQDDKVKALPSDLLVRQFPRSALHSLSGR